jgi:hypothetical protein
MTFTIARRTTVIPRWVTWRSKLAYSRNGRTWHRPDDRTPLVPWGPEGSYDSDGLYPAQNPIVIDGQTWIYYMAECCRHSQWDAEEQ